MKRNLNPIAACLVVLSTTILPTERTAAQTAMPSGQSTDTGALIAQPAPGTARGNPKDGLKYVWIPPGTFMMGCSPGDSECTKLERPLHQVTISRGLWVGQTEVTVGAYKRFAAATRRQIPVKDSPNDNMPITNVTWIDARDYCGWAGGRLLTEAEWEYAARGGSSEPRYGNLDEIAWYAKNSSRQIHEVAQKNANSFGLFDVLGNMWEWVNDWYPNYGETYKDSPVTDPQGAADPTDRRVAGGKVLRGGAWTSSSTQVRVSFRGSTAPDLTIAGMYGIRCVVELDGR